MAMLPNETIRLTDYVVGDVMGGKDWWSLLSEGSDAIV